MNFFPPSPRAPAPTAAFRLLALLGAAVLVASPALRATTINFGSTVGAQNICSDGSPLDGGFTFQLGTFQAGFVPSAANQSEWARRWVPLVAADGSPLAAATVTYDDAPLDCASDDHIAVNAFGGAAELDHNQSPFLAGSGAYIFAFDGATPATSSQWLVLTDPTWLWPDAKVFSPAHSFAVGDSTVALVGRTHDAATGAQLVSAPRGEGSVLRGYENWANALFPAELWSLPELVADFVARDADPDQDGLTNVAEFFLGSDPMISGGGTPLAIRPDATHRSLQIAFARSKTAGGVAGGVQSSGDLSAWSRPSIDAVSIEDLGETEIITLSVPMDSARSSTFYRLNIEAE